MAQQIDTLTRSEGVELLHPWVDAVAREAGVRALLMKGPLLGMQGLRAPRNSVDADVLVDPSAFDLMCDALERLGWEPRKPRSLPDSGPLAEITMHSETYHHPAWPCEIDLHYEFPGLLCEPQQAFDVLWARRDTITMGHREVTCCDPMGNAIIGGLHALRDPAIEMYQQQLAYLVAALDRRLDTEGRRELAELAAAVGAADSFRPVLDALMAPKIGSTDPRRFRDWQLRTSVGAHRGVMWLAELARTPAHKWPGTVWRALLLSEEELRSTRTMEPGPHGLRRARIERLRTVLPMLPHALKVLWRNRRVVR